MYQAENCSVMSCQRGESRVFCPIRSGKEFCVHYFLLLWWNTMISSDSRKEELALQPQEYESLRWWRLMAARGRHHGRGRKQSQARSREPTGSGPRPLSSKSGSRIFSLSKAVPPKSPPDNCRRFWGHSTLRFCKADGLCRQLWGKALEIAPVSVKFV